MRIYHYAMPREGCHRIRYMAAFKGQSAERTTEIRKWCYQTFGTPGIRVDTDEIIWQDGVQNGEIVFDREENLMLFVLKFGT
jgi:hypothetical protein